MPFIISPGCSRISSRDNVNCILSSILVLPFHEVTPRVFDVNDCAHPAVFATLDPFCR